VPRIFTLWPAPVRVIELVPFVNVEPAPELSQLPFTVMAAVVRVRIPEVPPVIVKAFQLLAIVLMVTIPRLPMENEPTVPPRRPVPVADASSVVVFETSSTVRVPLHRSGRVARVKVRAVLEEDWKWTLKNSGLVKLAGVNARTAAALLKRTVLVPTAQLPEVELFA
jgi:hypothetical protein